MSAARIPRPRISWASRNYRRAPGPLDDRTGFGDAGARFGATAVRTIIAVDIDAFWGTARRRLIDRVGQNGRSTHDLYWAVRCPLCAISRIRTRRACGGNHDMSCRRPRRLAGCFGHSTLTCDVTLLTRAGSRRRIGPVSAHCSESLPLLSRGASPPLMVAGNGGFAVGTQNTEGWKVLCRPICP
jgi:hypothetical protein